VEIDDPGIEKSISFQQERKSKNRMEGYVLTTSYPKKGKEQQRDEIRDALETCVQEEARKILIADILGRLSLMVASRYIIRWRAKQ